MFAQDVTSDSLQKAILSYSWYVPECDLLIDQLEKNEANITFLMDNIGHYAEDEDGIVIPIFGYLAKHSDLISLDRITRELEAQNQDFEIVLYLLDFKFENLIQYLKYLDELQCNESINLEISNSIKSLRQEVQYKYLETIPYVHDVDKTFFLFELKPDTDVKAFYCLIRKSFPDFYKKASSIVDVNLGIGDPLICVPFEKGTVVDETPYADYVKKMYEIGYCNYHNLLMQYRGSND